MAPKGTNPAYWITVECKSQGIQIIADMPEHWGYHVSSTFDSPRGVATSASGVLGGLSKEVSAAAEAFGGNLIFKGLTKRVWTGSSPVSLDLELYFDAETNTKKDVHEALTLLSSLALPGTLVNLGPLGDILVPPNPTRLDSDLNRVTIKIGNQYFWDDVTIDSATPGVDMRLSKDTVVDGYGWPIAGMIRLAATTEYVLSKADLFRIAQLDIGTLGTVQAATDPSPVPLTPAQLSARRNN